MWTPMVDVVPPGKSGSAEVDHVVVSEWDARFAAIRGERLRPGPLARLLVHGGIMMSDGAEEKRSNSEAVRRANGDVLVAGLGLGMVLVPMLQKPEVRSVLVLENNPHVMALVERHVRRYVGKKASAKLTVIEADVFTWEIPKGQKWDCIYLDVWPGICPDNLEGVTKLKRRYSKRLRRDNPNFWIGAWEEARLRLRNRREARAERLRVKYRFY